MEWTQLGVFDALNAFALCSVSDSTHVYVGGGFTASGGTTLNYVARRWGVRLQNGGVCVCFLFLCVVAILRPPNFPSAG